MTIPRTQLTPNAKNPPSPSYVYPQPPKQGLILHRQLCVFNLTSTHSSPHSQSAVCRAVQFQNLGRTAPVCLLYTTSRLTHRSARFAQGSFRRSKAVFPLDTRITSLVSENLRERNGRNVLSVTWSFAPSISCNTQFPARKTVRQPLRLILYSGFLRARLLKLLSLAIATVGSSSWSR